MINKNLKIYDADTSLKELVKETVVNFLYGFIANTITVFIVLEFDKLVFANLLLYYIFVSVVINRKRYTTKLGKYIIFPVACSIGAFLGYKIAYFLTPLFN